MEVSRGRKRGGMGKGERRKGEGEKEERVGRGREGEVEGEMDGWTEGWIRRRSSHRYINISDGDFVHSPALTFAQCSAPP